MRTTPILGGEGCFPTLIARWRHHRNEKQLREDTLYLDRILFCFLQNFLCHCIKYGAWSEKCIGLFHVDLLVRIRPKNTFFRTNN